MRKEFGVNQAQLIHLHVFHRARHGADVAGMRCFDQDDFKIGQQRGGSKAKKAAILAKDLLSYRCFLTAHYQFDLCIPCLILPSALRGMPAT